MIFLWILSVVATASALLAYMGACDAYRTAHSLKTDIQWLKDRVRVLEDEIL
jgi:hypothetical protein